MKNYTYSYRTKMGTRQYATKTTYGNRSRSSGRRSSYSVGDYAADRIARSVVKMLFK